MIKQLQDLTIWNDPKLFDVSLYDLKSKYDDVIAPRSSGTQFFQDNLFTLKNYVELHQNMISYIFTVCEHKTQPDFVKFQSVSLLQRYLKAKNYSLKKERMQLIALSCILLASKQCDEEIQIKKIHKYAGYSFTNQDFSTCQLKILKSLNFKLVNLADDIYGYTQLCLLSIKSLLPNDENVTFNWLQGFSINILEMLYQNNQFFHSYSIPELATGLIQTSIIILSKFAGASPITLRLSNFTRVDIITIEKVSKRMLKHVLGEHIYNQFKF
eukprot:403365321